MNKSYEVGFYSKSYSYYWVTGKDTLDFSLNITEYEKDSSVHFNMLHNKPILFSTVLVKIKDCIPLIKHDFDISKLRSLSFRSTIYYLDLTKKLFKDYEQKFCQKNIGYNKLNIFLLQSNLNLQVNTLIRPLNKKVKYYVIEKFHLLDKENFKYYLTNIDLSKYPKFTLGGMGIYMQLVNE
ncbi:MAG TPA: hypothetical protein VFM79_04260 [Pelobium sp.]|nr:hypothetical protein [Pelobium sp.]